MHEDDDITIRDLYPNMTEAELEEAAANLRRYVGVIARIYEKTVAAGKQWPGPVDTEELTEPTRSSTISEERSNSPQHN